MVRSVRGMVSIAVDTNFVFHRTFIAKYKDVIFKYVKSKNHQSDGIVAMITNNAEHTFNVMSELVSIFSYARDKAFIIQDWCHDSYRGDLESKQPGITQNKMLNYDFESCMIAGDMIIFYECPLIDDDDKSNLVRLYRLARVEEYINSISAFLYYYHIIDYPFLNTIENVFPEYINEFAKRNTDSAIIEMIGDINKHRAFERNESSSTEKKYDGTLGYYMTMKVRDSVGHIVRREENNAVNLRIDSLIQGRHLRLLVRFMREVARDKLNEKHEFNNYCNKEVFALHENN